VIDSGYALEVVLVMAAVTVALRALPFLAAPWLKRFPLITRLGRFLPSAIMTLLLLDTLRGAMTHNPAGPWQELVAIAVAIGLQGRTRQPLLSILAATALYVAFRNLSFFS
jgi:branched-subunit amino acid transport protein AzlD